MNETIIPADKQYRRRLIVIYIPILVIGLVLVGWGIPWLHEYMRNLAPREALNVTKTTLAIVFLSIIPIALYLFTLGRKVIGSGRFPPPGVKVVRDTTLLEGGKARFRGRVLVVLSICLIFLSILGAIYTLHTLNKLAPEKGKPLKSKSTLVLDQRQR
jgi:hypothetical protein